MVERQGIGAAPPKTILISLHFNPFKLIETAALQIEKSNVETARLLKLQETLEARKALGGEGGGRVELNLISEADKKIQDAAKFFEGTQLAADILKSNEKNAKGNICSVTIQIIRRIDN